MMRGGLGANETDPLTAFSSPALSIFESSTPIIFLVRATWFEADFSSPPLSPWPLCIYESLIDLRVCEFTSRSCALRQHYITTATLWWETERKQREKEEKNPGADYMGTSGHKIDRTEDERSFPKKQNKKNTTAGIIVNLRAHSFRGREPNYPVYHPP